MLYCETGASNRKNYVGRIRRVGALLQGGFDNAQFIWHNLFRHNPELGRSGG